MVKTPSDVKQMDRLGVKGGLVGQIRAILGYRELLVNLVRKELKVKYRNSAMGFLWSMLNPALYLVIFYVVFTRFLGTQIPYFPIYLLSGLLAWNLFSSSLGSAAGSLVNNSSLVTKVHFPREILPLASIGAALVHFFLQFLVLLAGLLIFKFPVSFNLFLFVPGLITELVLIAAICLIIAPLNVYFRDVQHFLELALLAWFWMTPIVYPISLVQGQLEGTFLWTVYRLNPMVPIVLLFQRGIYNHVSLADSQGNLQRILISEPISWYAQQVLGVFLFAVALFLIGMMVFRRVESRLAEEL